MTHILMLGLSQNRWRFVASKSAYFGGNSLLSAREHPPTHLRIGSGEGMTPARPQLIGLERTNQSPCLGVNPGGLGRWAPSGG